MRPFGDQDRTSPHPTRIRSAPSPPMAPGRLRLPLLATATWERRSRSSRSGLKGHGSRWRMRWGAVGWPAGPGDLGGWSGRRVGRRYRRDGERLGAGAGWGGLVTARTSRVASRSSTKPSTDPSSTKRPRRARRNLLLRRALRQWADQESNLGPPPYQGAFNQLSYAPDSF